MSHTHKYLCMMINIICFPKQKSNVILFKATNFPYDWVASDTLIKNVRFKDATLLSMDELNVIITQ